MPNGIELLLQALAGVPQVTSPLTPPFVPPNSTVPLTTAGQAPVPQYGGPSQVVEPPQAPLDLSAVRQLLATQAPPPQAPAPLGQGQRIANALMGFGAGVQGNLPQYLEQLQRPQREYQQQLRDYNAERSRLAQGGIEIGLRQQEARTRRAQELADRDAQREFQLETRRLRLSDDESRMRLEQAYQNERDARQARIQEAHQLAIEQRQKENDARTIAGRLGSGAGAAPPLIAKELGEYYANIRHTVSPAAAKWVNAQARRADILASRPVGGGVSRRDEQNSQRRMSQAAAGIANMEKLARQAMESPEAKRGPILNQMRSMAAGLQAQFPELLEVGQDNGWPFARLRQRGGQAQPQGQPQADPLGVLQR